MHERKMAGDARHAGAAVDSVNWGTAVDDAALDAAFGRCATQETVALDGRFALSALVSEVANASLWRGHMRPSGEPLALLVFDTNAESDPSAPIRLMQVVETLTDIDRDGAMVVRGFADDAERIVVVMEPVQGQSLRTVLVRESPLPPQRAIALVAALAESLVSGHRAGEVWGGLEPESFVVDGGGEGAMTACVLPAALWIAAQGDMDTLDLGLRGVVYRAPEVLLGEARGPASDVFSLGVMLFELVTGESPFEGHTVRTMIARVISAPVRSVVGLVADASGAEFATVDRLVERLTRKAASERPVDAHAALALLRAAM